ncbi:hypothetical protein, partial [Rothia dentocariosa]
ETTVGVVQKNAHDPILTEYPSTREQIAIRYLFVEILSARGKKRHTRTRTSVNLSLCPCQNYL